MLAGDGSREDEESRVGLKVVAEGVPVEEDMVVFSEEQIESE